LFSSCSSESPVLEDTPVVTNNKYKATFKIGSPSLEISESPMRSSTLYESHNIQHLEYWIYKSSSFDQLYNDGEPLEHALIAANQKEQTISVELPIGDYMVVFYAADTMVDTTNFKQRGAGSVRATNHYSQSFGKRFQFQITETNKGVSETVKLERLVGKVELVIEDLDKLPSDVQAIIPVLSGFRFVTVDPLMGVVPSFIDIARGGRNYFTESGNYSYFPIIERELFSAVTEKDPIFFYSIPSEYSRFPGISVVAADLYIQGVKDRKYHSLDARLPLLTQDPNVVFMRKVGQYKVKVNETTRYTGKIGNLDGSGMPISEKEMWDELSYEIEK
ncbi:MAG: hypothetical protein RL662_1249, partial [Bacteroidota bacterium]|jgi:hypothetical protein